jgi:hypothetical protein
MRGTVFLENFFNFYSSGEIICRPTGGKAKLEIGCGFKVKNY